MESLLSRKKKKGKQDERKKRMRMQKGQKRERNLKTFVVTGKEATCTLIL